MVISPLCCDDPPPSAGERVGPSTLVCLRAIRFWVVVPSGTRSAGVAPKSVPDHCPSPPSTASRPHPINHCGQATPNAHAVCVISGSARRPSSRHRLPLWVGSTAAPPHSHHPTTQPPETSTPLRTPIHLIPLSFRSQLARLAGWLRNTMQPNIDEQHKTRGCPCAGPVHMLHARCGRAVRLPIACVLCALCTLSAVAEACPPFANMLCSNLLRRAGVLIPPASRLARPPLARRRPDATCALPLQRQPARGPASHSPAHQVQVLPATHASTRTQARAVRKHGRLATSHLACRPIRK